MWELLFKWTRHNTQLCLVKNRKWDTFRIIKNGVIVGMERTWNSAIDAYDLAKRESTRQ